MGEDYLNPTIIRESDMNTKLLAEFVSEALCGLGVADDADELLGYVYDAEGDEAARETMKRYNNAIEFVNEHLKQPYTPISEEKYLMYTGQD